MKHKKTLMSSSVSARRNLTCSVFCFSFRIHLKFSSSLNQTPVCKTYTLNDISQKYKKIQKKRKNAKRAVNRHGSPKMLLLHYFLQILKRSEIHVTIIKSRIFLNFTCIYVSSWVYFSSNSAIKCLIYKNRSVSFDDITSQSLNSS